VSKLLFGFGLVTAAIFLIFYSTFTKVQAEDWYFWGIAAAILFNIGLYLLITAAVHKMKNDMVRRQKKTETQKTLTGDE
jgi:ABC-type nickel/cobalt efflux system permease component RcnA